MKPRTQLVIALIVAVVIAAAAIGLTQNRDSLSEDVGQQFDEKLDEALGRP